MLQHSHHSVVSIAIQTQIEPSNLSGEGPPLTQPQLTSYQDLRDKRNRSFPRWHLEKWTAARKMITHLCRNDPDLHFKDYTNKPNCCSSACMKSRPWTRSATNSPSCAAETWFMLWSYNDVGKSIPISKQESLRTKTFGRTYEYIKAPWTSTLVETHCPASRPATCSGRLP